MRRWIHLLFASGDSGCYLEGAISHSEQGEKRQTLAKSHEKIDIGWFEFACLQFGYSARFHRKLSYQYLIRKGTSRLICHVDGLITIPAQTPGGREPCDEIESSSTFGDLAVRGVEEFAGVKTEGVTFLVLQVRSLNRNSSL